MNLRLSRARTLAATLAGGMTLALTLSACGTTDTTDTTEATGTTAPASAACAEDTTATSTDPVSLTDSDGRTLELDAPAKRVVALEWQEVEDLLTLCLTPVGVADPEGYATWVTAETLPAGVADMGERQEPDLEAILAQDPDLVVVEAGAMNSEIIGRLEERDVKVLVTKGADASGQIDNMKRTFELIAQATGRTEQAEQVLKGFDARLAEAKGQVQNSTLSTDEFVYFDGWLDAGNLTIRPYGKGALFTELGEQLGLKAAWTDEVNSSYGSGGVDPAYGLAQTDVEGLTAVGQANLFYANDDSASGYLEELQKNPIWQALPAVKEGRAFSFPPRIWGAGGPRSVLQATDAYVDIITGQ